MAESMAPVVRDAILIVKEHEPTRRLLADYLQSAGHQAVQAAGGLEAIGAISRYGNELGAVLLDLHMPGVSGFEVLRQIRSDMHLDQLPVIVVTAECDRDVRRRAAAMGADEFLPEPVDQVELVARVRHLLHVRGLWRRMISAQGMLDMLAAAIERRDRYTGDHAHRVAAFAVRTAEALGLEPQVRLPILEGAIIRDVGMVTVPDAILHSPRALSEVELTVVQRHVIEGVAICHRLDPDSILLQIVRHHHERWDGTGYPDHLRGRSIPVGARIVAVCDAFDAMVSERPYRSAMPWSEAHLALQAGAGTQWDPDAVAALQRVLASDGPLVEAAHLGGQRLTQMLTSWRDRLARQVDRTLT